MSDLLASIGFRDPALLGLDALLNYDNSKSEETGFDALLSGMVGGGASKTNIVEQILVSHATGTLHTGSLSLATLLGISDSIAAPGLYPETLENRAALEAAIGSHGPLPEYLRMVVAGRGLSKQQTQALYEITARNMDIVKSVESVNRLAQELRDAGIA